MKDISIIIPVSNCANAISKLLLDLKHQSFHNFEVIFIDNCSYDQTPQQIRAFQRLSGIQCHIVTNRLRQNIATSYNQGMTMASGDRVIFLSPQSSLSADYLNNLMDLNAEIAGYHQTTHTLFNGPEQLTAFLSYQIPTHVVGLLIRRELMRGLRFNDQLKQQSEKLMAYQLYSRSNTTSFIQGAPATTTTNVHSQHETPPLYREALAYLAEVRQHIQSFCPELSQVAWLHHHFELSTVYRQIRRLSFNSRTLYSEELRQLKNMIKEIEAQKLSFSPQQRLQYWANRHLRLPINVQTRAVGV